MGTEREGGGGDGMSSSIATTKEIRAKQNNNHNLTDVSFDSSFFYVLRFI